jgi:hypothetical protein
LRIVEALRKRLSPTVLSQHVPHPDIRTCGGEQIHRRAAAAGRSEMTPRQACSIMPVALPFLPGHSVTALAELALLGLPTVGNCEDRAERCLSRTHQHSALTSMI